MVPDGCYAGQLWQAALLPSEIDPTCGESRVNGVLKDWGASGIWALSGKVRSLPSSFEEGKGPATLHEGAPTVGLLTHTREVSSGVV